MHINLRESIKDIFRSVIFDRKDHETIYIGETLILPSAVKIISNMIGEEYANRVKSVPLSRGTVSRRIRLISQNIENIFVVDTSKENLSS